MYKRLLIVTFTIIGLCMVLSLLPIHGESEIYDNVLRLHVIANSDSDEDQELKLRVRDGILASTEHIFKNCKNREEAKSAVINNLEFIRASAQRTVDEAGYNYSVSVELGEEEYPTKNYESFCFPSGEYLSLRVKLGEAEGENWWCVLFPPMCLGAASQADAYVQSGLTNQQYQIITETKSPKYNVRFKLLEAIEKAIK